MAIRGGEESIRSRMMSLKTGIENETAITEKTIDIMGSRILVYGKKKIMRAAIMIPTDWIVSPNMCIQAARML